MKPARGLVQVRPLQTEERFPGSAIVLLESTRERLTAQQAEVVAVGADEVCADDACERQHWLTGTGITQLHPCELEPGDWILVEPRVEFELADGSRLVRQAHVVARINAR